MLGPLQGGEWGNASLQWPGPRGTSSGDDGMLPTLSHLGGSAKSEEPCDEACLVFPQQGTGLRPTTHQMATALAAKTLGWIQHVVME